MPNKVKSRLICAEIKNVISAITKTERRSQINWAVVREKRPVLPSL
jgi:hypothetical protein